MTVISPEPSSEEARRRMVANRRRDTKPELRIRSALHRRGMRFFVDRAPLKGMRRRADIVFPRLQVAVYVDGCFWHGCPIHGTWPKANSKFWRNKIETNQLRDADTNARLDDAGWTVVRVWEHEDPREAVGRIGAIIEERRTLRPGSNDEREVPHRALRGSRLDTRGSPCEPG